MIAKMLRLEYVMRGIKRRATPGNHRRLPITPMILLLMKQFWAADSGNADSKMLWAASCLCFFGFLRLGEVVAPSESQFDPEANLCFEDIRVDSRSHPTYMQVILKASKTDLFRQGTSLFIGATDSQLCPVAAVLSFMVARGRAAGPLFSWKNGCYLTKDKFVAEIRKVLTAVGLKPEEYAGHSFRIGAATTAAQMGLQDSLIKTLGRWQSSAYTLCIKTPKERCCVE